MAMTNQPVKALDWGSPITKESDYVELAPGTYTFMVSNFERKEYAGDPSKGLPACPIAQYTLTTQTPDGPANINHSLFLNSSNEGKIGIFFRALGMKNSDTYVPQWNDAVGKTLVAEVDHDRNNPKYMRVKRIIVQHGQTQQAPQQAAPAGNYPIYPGTEQPYPQNFQQTYTDQANFNMTPHDEQF